ncbi:integrase, catalytic region, zinc finger, CCHC-type containing protein [Tanacetum coccineum]
MTGNHSRLKNFVKKFIGTVKFGDDHFGAIMGYVDYVIGDIMISKVYYVEGLGHILFSVGQFCDSDLEVAFRKHSCYVRDVNGVDLLKGSRGLNLYTISVEDMMKSSLICLFSKASKNKSWLWHRRLNHLNFGEQCPLTRFTISKVVPLNQPEHVSSTEIMIPERFSNTTQTPLTRYKRRNKQKKAISTSIPIITVLQTIDVPIVLWYLDSGCSKHMTGNHSRLKNFVKKFIGTVKFGNDHFGAIMGYGYYVIGDIVISKVYYVEGLGHILFSVGQFCDSDLEVAFRKHSCYVRDVNGVDLLKGSRGLNLYTISVEDMMKSSLICLFLKASKNKSWLWHRRLNHLNFGTINDFARKDLCQHLYQKFVPRTPQQNVVVKRQNRTLVEVARTMLIFSKAPMFLWAEVVATACYTQNRSLIHTHHNKTPYELIHDKKPDLKFLRVFGALCYPTNDSEDLGKLKATADIGIFVELTEQMAYVHISTGPKPILLTSGQISSGLIPNLVPVAPYVPPSNKDLEILFQPMFDEYLEPPSVERSVPPAPTIRVPVVSAVMHCLPHKGILPVITKAVPAGPTIEAPLLLKPDLIPQLTLLMEN